MAGDTIAICSFRLGGTDGVAIESAKWHDALCELGYQVRSIAGSGVADRIIPGLAIGAKEPPRRDELEVAFKDVALVIVENICSLPLNITASRAVAEVLAGRAALLHHHDLALERAEYASFGPPPSDQAWQHVCISHCARELLRPHGIDATVVYNTFDCDPAPGRRDLIREHLGVKSDEFIVLQPTRAIARKAVPRGLAIAEFLRATYWLTGPAEDGYGPELALLLEEANTKVIYRSIDVGHETIADAYAACDLVVLPSTWEGFGNPTLEAATHRRACVVGDYPVANELRCLGFVWPMPTDMAAIERLVRGEEANLYEYNLALARAHFNVVDLPGRIAAVLDLLA